MYNYKNKTSFFSPEVPKEWGLNSKFKKITFNKILGGLFWGEGSLTAYLKTFLKAISKKIIGVISFGGGGPRIYTVK